VVQREVPQQLARSELRAKLGEEGNLSCSVHG
jgi:hypothetical protein